MIFFWAWGKKLSSWRENVGQQWGWLSWACGRVGWYLQSACCRNASLCQGFSVSSLSAGGTPCLPSLPSLRGLGLFLYCRLVHRRTGGIQLSTSMCSVQGPVLSLSGSLCKDWFLAGGLCLCPAALASSAGDLFIYGACWKCDFFT